MKSSVFLEYKWNNGRETKMQYERENREPVKQWNQTKQRKLNKRKTNKNKIIINNNNNKKVKNKMQIL